MRTYVWTRMLCNVCDCVRTHRATDKVTTCHVLAPPLLRCVEVKNSRHCLSQHEWPTRSRRLASVVCQSLQPRGGYTTFTPHYGSAGRRPVRRKGRRRAAKFRASTTINGLASNAAPRATIRHRLHSSFSLGSPSVARPTGYFAKILSSVLFDSGSVSVALECILFLNDNKANVVPSFPCSAAL